MQWTSSRVLVTGGAGFVGSHIVDALLRRGASEIVVLDNLTRGVRENLAQALASGRVRLVEGDIRDRPLLGRLLSGIDCLFHQAAIRITQCAAEPRLCLEVLVDGTFNVLEAAVEAGVRRVVAASSASVYGLAERFPTEESHHPYNNRTWYGAAKVANEQMLRAFHDMYGLSYVALRYFNVYGPRMDLHGAYTEVLIRWLDCIDRGEPPLVFGDGRQSMDWVYVEDVAEANLLAAESEVEDEVFNVGSGVETTLLEVWEILKELTGSDLEPVHLEERKTNPVRRRQACTRRAAERLGFVARVDLREGLRRLVEWRRSRLAGIRPPLTPPSPTGP
ncbi:MAG TPA: SDR family NAD(P)-dependent oxidoreductase [Candidatus Nitrosotenuis sp.]|nr:SDR family NAD(P)-dependent oxidoreductase [Candidatus Nitrosotenuis sp.]